MSLLISRITNPMTWLSNRKGMQGSNKITIKSVSKAAPRIKIRRKLMSNHDVRSLTSEVLRFNNINPLKKQTIEDFLEKTSEYLKIIESKSTNLIRIKSVKLYQDRFK